MNVDDRQEKSFVNKDGKSKRNVGRTNAWLTVNVVAALALGVYAAGWEDRVYPWLLRQELIFPLALISLVAAVPAIRWLIRTNHRVVATWGVLATALVALAAPRAAHDSQRLHNYNCWTVSERVEGRTSYQTVACASGSEPKEGAYFDQFGSGQSRFCESPDPWANGPEDPVVALARKADAANVTIWQCEQSNYEE